MDNRQALIDRSIPFLQEVKDMTPGAEMERWLNAKYIPESALYRDLSRLIKLVHLAGNPDPLEPVTPPAACPSWSSGMASPSLH